MAVLIIFPVILQTIINLRMPSIAEQEASVQQMHSRIILKSKAYNKSVTFRQVQI